MSELAAEVDDFFGSQPAAPVPDENAPAEPASAPPPPDPAAPPPAPGYWDERIDEPDLPPSLRGSTIRQYVDSTKRALAEQHAAGQRANAAEARAQAAELFAQALSKRFEQPQAPPQQRQPFGDEVYNEGQLPGVLNERIPELVDRRAQELVAPLNERVQQLQRDAIFQQSENARLSARTAANIDAETWDHLRPALASLVSANGYDPRDPGVWKWAADTYRATAARLVPQVSMTGAPPAPATGNGRPPVTPAAQRAPVSTGNKRVDDNLRGMIEAWNQKSPVKVKFDEVASSINDSRSTEGWD